MFMSMPELVEEAIVEVVEAVVAVVAVECVVGRVVE